MAPKVRLLATWPSCLLLWLNLTGLALATLEPKCKQGAYSLFLPLSAYSPAQSFCSAQFPVQPTTLIVTQSPTSTAKIVTITVTSETSTLSTTTTKTESTTTTTTTTDHTVTTTTSISTSFIATTTVGVLAVQNPPDKRAAPSCSAGSKLRGAGGRKCTVECGKNRQGTSYKQFSAKSFQACTDACVSDAHCASAQYCTSSETCYLKTTADKSFPDSDFNGVVCKKPCSGPPNPGNHGVSLESLLARLKAQERAFVSTLCSCIQTPPVTVQATVTKTIVVTGTSTKPATATSTTTISETTTSISTVTTGTTVTSTDTSVITTSITSTSTNTACSAVYTSFNGIANDCTVSDGIARAFPTNGPPYYYAVFNGQGVTENTDNMGNNGPTIRESFTDIPAANNCDAINRCANFCLPSTNINEQFWSFDLHYYCLAEIWECICYNDYQYYSDPFNVLNPLISQAYGYCAYFPDN